MFYWLFKTGKLSEDLKLASLIPNGPQPDAGALLTHL